MSNEVNVGLIGFGTIGAGAVEIFNKNQELLNEKTGKKLVLKKVADLDITSDRGVKIEPELLTTDVNEILNDDEIDIVIELMGGYEPARTFILKALNNGKHVVSANKALIAKHWEELIDTATKNNVRILFEASVGGGIPLLTPFNEALSSNRIDSIYGIMNGTANYILTKMTEEGLDFDSVLKEAQEKGYAEADPTFDIEGHDTAQKLIILTKIGFGEYVPQENFTVEGITKITPTDINFANNELDYSIKLLGIAKKINGNLEIRVHPTFVPKTHLLSSVNDVYNAVYLVGDFVGPVLLYGQGAGRMATASAVMGDVIDIVLNPEKEINYGPKTSQIAKVKKIEDLNAKYYIRLTAVDQPGVLYKVGEVLKKYNIGIESMTQKGNSDKQPVPIILVTHHANESDIEKALGEINNLDVVKGETIKIRILD
ncbi:MAG: homoserine dehydrogenase [Methanobrevibacter sp.]|jgi:homoserine dehydrogenase|nr:homoserine dehydrogenase [Candidatus Methanoflexus mossambicus]